MLSCYCYRILQNTNIKNCFMFYFSNREAQMIAEKRPCPEGMRPNCYVEEDRTNYPALLGRERALDGTLYTHVCDTHGLSGHAPPATLLGKEMTVAPPPFSTATTFKLTSASCVGDHDGSPTMAARGVDVISGGCNTMLSPSYGFAQPAKKLHLYETSTAMTGSKAVAIADVLEPSYHTPMYFDLAEPSAKCGALADKGMHT